MRNERKEHASSGTFRLTLCTARAEECDQMTGDWENAMAWSAVASDVWERSTSTPSRLSSYTSSRPSFLYEVG